MYSKTTSHHESAIANNLSNETWGSQSSDMRGFASFSLGLQRSISVVLSAILAAASILTLASTLLACSSDSF